MKGAIYVKREAKDSDAGDGDRFLFGGYGRLRRAGQHRSDLLMVARSNLAPLAG